MIDNTKEFEERDTMSNHVERRRRCDKHFEEFLINDMQEIQEHLNENIQ